MASGVVNVQSAVHSMDQGKFSHYIRIGMFFLVLIGVTLLYLFVQFKGLANPSAMDQAQIARNLARGDGYTTEFIRPIALKMMREQNKDVEAYDLKKFPDFYQSPLSPFINSFVLRMIKNDWKLSPSDFIYAGDRAIVITSTLFFLASIGVWYLVLARLFDSRLALVAAAAVLVTNMMWQFCLSGLPQMLVLFLFGLACWGTLKAMDAQDRDQVGATLGWLGGAGVVMGLATLAHGLFAWVFLGWLIFVGLFFRPRALTIATALVAFLVVLMPWCARNYQVCGHPFGLAIFDAFHENSPEEGYQRGTDTQMGDPNVSMKGKFRVNLLLQMEGLFGLLGLNIAAGGFFLALMHRFRNPQTARFKWGVLLMWVFAVIGMSFYRATYAMENQLHVIFIPLFVAFGLAFLFVLWSRLELGASMLRVVFVTLILFVCSIPMLLTLFAGSPGRVQWPPYLPPIIGFLNNWFNDNEVVCSDMPWAVAWYADRTSLLLPETVRELNRMHDYAETKQPICGLFLTPISGDQKLFSSLYSGNYKEWSPLLMRPPKLQGFPFGAFVPLPIDQQCLLFADRDRWSNPELGN